MEDLTIIPENLKKGDNMIVITVTDTPPKIRGDLSKWLLEVNTGVYVGNVSARVRDKLWERVCENLKNGRATMVYNASNEQKMDFRVYNSAWEPVDYEGLKLIRHPATGCRQEDQEDNLTRKGFSNAAKRAYVQKITNDRIKNSNDNRDYTVIDLETTGLSYETDSIIEAAALRVSNGEVTDEFSKLVRFDKPLPKSIIQLTGITDEILTDSGEPINTVLEQFIEFIHADVLVGYNISFDLNFLQAACHAHGLTMQRDFKMIDILQMARKKVKSVSNYKLNTLAQYFDVDISGMHRALGDCYLAYDLFEKLNKI